MGAVCADVVESLNAILNWAYNHHTARGGGGVPGATSLEREAEVVLQVWEWWFLKLDLPLTTQGTPLVATCTMATLMSSHSPPPMSLSLAPPALVSPIHGPGRNGGVDGEDVREDERQSGMCLRVHVFHGGAVSSVLVRDPPPPPRALRAHLVTKGHWLLTIHARKFFFSFPLPT